MLDASVTQQRVLDKAIRLWDQKLAQFKTEINIHELNKRLEVYAKSSTLKVLQDEVKNYVLAQQGEIDRINVRTAAIHD
jgi:hypothetical protein